MRVAVDARALVASRGSRGVTRYGQASIEALALAFPDDRLRLFVPGREAQPAIAGLARLPNVSVRRHRLSGRALFGAAAVTGRPRLDRLAGGNADVVWAPTIAPLALSAGVPLVLTIQDLSFERRPSDFTPYERLWHALARPRALARRAQRVIVLAPPTRDELIERWGLAADAVRVVPPGVRRPDPSTDDHVLLRFGLTPQGYLLAVGALEPRKAPELLARAFAEARRQGLGAELVYAGEGRLADRLGGTGVKLLGRVSDADLDALYRGALALVVPSLLEGYGLHLREALAHGTPAIVSDLPVFGPELSEAVLSVPVGDESALARALLQIDREDGLRARLAAAARPAVADASWSSAALQTRAVLAEAITVGARR
jgi:glycosyltransferase involved in cell wall biosynthesis